MLCVSRSIWDHSLQASFVRALLPTIGHRAGSEKRVHPYGLRHTCAAELTMERIPVHVIRNQLGHASLQTTQVYTHVSKERLLRVYDDTHPRA